MNACVPSVLPAMELIYDVAKSAINLDKHGIALADALLVYNCPQKLTLESLRHGEKRWMDIAMVPALGLVLVLVYVVRNNMLRAISLRRASASERRLYESERDRLG